MSAKVIDGRQVAAEVRAELAERIKMLAGRGIVPGLGVILVGDNPASLSYVTGKERACAEMGIYSDNQHLPKDTPHAELLSLIQRMNRDSKIHGILVQLPLPDHIREQEVLLAIDPDKDVDGFHPVNIGRLVMGAPRFLPPTPHGVVRMLVASGVRIPGSHVVIVGRSNIVGKPLANMLIQRGEEANATVTLCHTKTADLPSHTRRADILVAAAGSPGMITADMVKDGAAVIDVGTNRIDDPTKKRGYRLTGDVEFETVREKASVISPVPNGVGPMTITMLLANTVLSAELANGGLGRDQ
ncbi:MAG TPA: bifunctional methylenetetrahydrofolate dehydrogenase/methenyltetrahydrofolate cyclohydrolase FolD [Spirochaetia bacterium]|nr:bifunctional methylenetetrahydrofolate dehydrogenase/methenyltetrahydrofolate cyclohydrolase FolD [Spirochaetia bacterium]